MKFFTNIKIQSVIALIIIAGGYSIITFTKVNDSDRIGIFNLMCMVAGYFFGSSKSSTVKDETISEMSKK